MNHPLLLAFLAACCLRPQSLAQPSASDLSIVYPAADSAIARPDLDAYRGWLKYLRFLAEDTTARHGADSAEAHAALARLDDWTRRITADPDLLGKLRGVQEWAYESPVDGSGQPFKVVIPTDYDPARPAPLSVYMHGYTGDHLNHSAGFHDHDGFFDVAVLGRARGGWYVGLSQADVLHVLDYIEAHWRIDAGRIRLSGGSMGGGATFKLGARFPHRFASGQIACGYVQQEPIGNLLTFPIYATHSDDDPVVSILLSRGPLAELRRRGGQAIFDETTGYGHAVWDYAAGNERSGAWGAAQVRPDSRTVRRLDFTAYDGAAMRCWWAEIAEWGTEARPARFTATAGEGNTLFVELDNVARLRLRTAESPFDPAQTLRVVVNGAVPIEIPAPLPGSIVVDGPGAPADVPPARLHTPGGPIQVYDGSPLLIVYGTGGDAATQAALRAVAEIASQSPNPSWKDDRGEIDPADQIPHWRNLFGRLAIKPDTAVNEADIARCNLVLIGTAVENSIVARIAAQLPVRLADGRIVCSDGFELPAAQRTLGLVHFNPLAPTRLVFWVASSSPAGYSAEAAVPALCSPLFIGADLLVTHAAERQLVAARSFDSRWRWLGGREISPVVSPETEDHPVLARRIAEAVRRATGADFAVAGRVPQLGAAPVLPGVTRVADLAPLFYGHTIDVLELTGAEVLAAQARMDAAAPDALEWVALQPAAPAALDPDRTYRVAVPMALVGSFGRLAKVSSHLQRRTDTTVPEALTRFLTRQ